MRESKKGVHMWGRRRDTKRTRKREGKSGRGATGEKER